MEGGGGYPLLSSAPHRDAGRRLDTGHLEELELLVSDAEEMLDGAEISPPDGFSLCSGRRAKRYAVTHQRSARPMCAGAIVRGKIPAGTAAVAWFVAYIARDCP